MADYSQDECMAFTKRRTSPASATDVLAGRSTRWKIPLRRTALEGSEKPAISNPRHIQIRVRLRALPVPVTSQPTRNDHMRPQSLSETHEKELN